LSHTQHALIQDLEIGPSSAKAVVYGEPMGRYDG